MPDYAPSPRTTSPATISGTAARRSITRGHGSGPHKGTEMPDYSDEFFDGAWQAADGFTRASKGLRFANAQLNVAYQGLMRATTAAQMPDSMDPVRDELGRIAAFAESLAVIVRSLAEEVQSLATTARGVREIDERRRHEQAKDGGGHEPQRAEAEEAHKVIRAAVAASAAPRPRWRARRLTLRIPARIHELLERLARDEASAVMAHRRRRFHHYDATTRPPRKEK
jgi:hypothetical protein